MEWHDASGGMFLLSLKKESLRFQRHVFILLIHDYDYVSNVMFSTKWSNLTQDVLFILSCLSTGSRDGGLRVR